MSGLLEKSDAVGWRMEAGFERVLREIRSGFERLSREEEERVRKERERKSNMLLVCFLVVVWTIYGVEIGLAVARS